MNQLPKVKRPLPVLPILSSILMLDAAATFGLGSLSSPVTLILGGFATYWAVRFWRTYWLILELWRHQNGKCDCHK